MSYKCTYEVLNKDKKVVYKEYLQACFSQYYDSFNKFKFVKYYIFKDYEQLSGGTDENHNNYSEKDILKYAKVLEKLGTKIEVNVNDSLEVYTNYQDDDDEDEETEGDTSKETLDCWSFTIPCNHALIVKVLLNCLRYLHENEIDYSPIPKALIGLDKNLKGVNIWNKILLAHYAAPYLGGGHDIIGNRMYIKLFTNKEYSQFFDDLKDAWSDNVNNNVNKHATNWKKNPGQKQLRDLLQQGKYGKAYRLYKKLSKLAPKPKPKPKPVVIDKKVEDKPGIKHEDFRIQLNEKEFGKIDLLAELAKDFNNYAKQEVKNINVEELPF